MVLMSLAGVGCFTVFGSSADTTNEQTVVASAPWPDSPDVTDPYDYYYGSDGSQGGGSGGNGTSDNNEDADIPCEVLLATKPPSCPSPIATPAGFDYGRDTYAGGSAMAKLIAYANNPSANGDARYDVKVALEMQTRMISERVNSVYDIQLPFFNLVSIACQLESKSWEGRRLGVELTTPERLCIDALGKAQAEADQSEMTFFGFFSRWLDKEGLDITDLFPQTVVNLFSPENSMTKKYDLVTADAKCATWWKQVQHNQCPAG
jgi:hypothetical protein